VNDSHKQLPLPAPGTVLYWFDFICPFCYVGQQRNQILERHGLTIVQLPFQIHPTSRLKASRQGRAAARCTAQLSGRPPWPPAAALAGTAARHADGVVRCGVGSPAPA
jgi:hypothetical protein